MVDIAGDDEGESVATAPCGLGVGLYHLYFAKQFADGALVVGGAEPFYDEGGTLGTDAVDVGIQV